MAYLNLNIKKQIKRMKKSILLLAAIASIASATHANVLTVSNDLAGGSQYSTLLGAYSIALSGDTLLIEGTNTVYQAPAPWAKQLVVIGIGFNPNK